MAASAASAELADKRIRVRVAEFDGHGYTYYDWQEKTINDRHTVEAAVREVYAPFPGYCSRVELRRPGAQVGFNVYRCMEDRKMRWAEDLYKMVMENDEVEIMLLVRQPWGPGVRYEDWEVSGEYAYHEAAGAHKAGGPGVAALLRRLRVYI